MATSPPFVEDLAALYELHLLATTYPALTPAMHLGFDPMTDAWISYQLNRATMTFGLWVDRRLRETVPVQVKALRPPAKGMAWGERPKYTYREALGLDRPEPVMTDDPAMVAQARALLRGEIDPATWGLVG